MSDTKELSSSAEKWSYSVTITDWNAARGFGFVVIEGRRAFVHANVIHPPQRRGNDLNGLRLIIKNNSVQNGPKGLTVLDASTEEEHKRETQENIERDRKISEAHGAVRLAVAHLDGGWQLGGQKNVEKGLGIGWLLRAPDDVEVPVSDAAEVQWQVDSYRARLQSVMQQERDKSAREYLTNLLERVKTEAPAYQSELDQIVQLRLRERELVQIQERSNERFEGEKPKEIAHKEDDGSQEGYYHATVTLRDRKGIEGVYHLSRIRKLKMDRRGQILEGSQLSPDGRRRLPQTFIETKYSHLSGADVLMGWQKEEAHRQRIYTDNGISTLSWHRDSCRMLNTLGACIGEGILPTLGAPAEVLVRVRYFMLDGGLNQPACILQSLYDPPSGWSKSNSPEDIERRDKDIDAFAVFQEQFPPTVLNGGDEVALALSRNLQPQLYDQRSGSMAYSMLKQQGERSCDQYLLAWTRSQSQGEESMKAVGEKFPPCSSEVFDQKRQAAWQYFVDSERRNQSIEREWKVPRTAESHIPSLPEPKMYCPPLAAMAYPAYVADEKGVCTIEWFMSSQEALSYSAQTLTVMKRRFDRDSTALQNRMAGLREEDEMDPELDSAFAALGQPTTIADFPQAFARLQHIEGLIKTSEQRVAVSKQLVREQSAAQQWPNIQSALTQLKDKLIPLVHSPYGIVIPASLTQLKEGYILGTPVHRLEETMGEDETILTLPLPHGRLVVYRHYRSRSEVSRRNIGWYVYARMEIGEFAVDDMVEVAQRSLDVAPVVNNGIIPTEPEEHDSPTAKADQLASLLAKFGRKGK